nr:hypothetical protein GCM10020093_033170 [Planobispora longispora]
MIDLDYFKRFNDTYGHQAGDRLLVGAATAWSLVITSDDMLARYGGEEFVLLMPGRTVEDAEHLLSALRLVTPEKQTFSAGLARWDGRESPLELLRRADGALYAAKEAGRDRVMRAGPAARMRVKSAPVGRHRALGGRVDGAGAARTGADGAGAARTGADGAGAARTGADGAGAAQAGDAPAVGPGGPL